MNGITEQKYLEICDEFKSIIGQKDRKNKQIITNLKILAKIIAEAYGVVKIIDNTLDSIDTTLESVIMVKKMIEILRTDLSDTVERMVCDEEDDEE